MKIQHDASTRVPAICSNCRFWIKNIEPHNKQGLDEGECHRFPPQLVPSEQGFLCLRPLTAWREFCGEFQLRLDA